MFNVGKKYMIFAIRTYFTARKECKNEMSGT